MNGYPPLLHGEDSRAGWPATKPAGSQAHAPRRQGQGGRREPAAAKQPAPLLLGRDMRLLVAEWAQRKLLASELFCWPPIQQDHAQGRESYHVRCICNSRDVENPQMRSTRESAFGET